MKLEIIGVIRLGEPKVISRFNIAYFTKYEKVFEAKASDDLLDVVTVHQG